MISVDCWGLLALLLAVAMLSLSPAFFMDWAQEKYETRREREYLNTTQNEQP